MSLYLPNKIVFVGDSKVGKTSFACSYLDNYFPDPKNIPVVRDPPIVPVMYNDKMIKIQPYDTAGSEDYAKLRSLAYSSTEVFVLCFSLVDKKSLEHIETYWIPEIQRECPNVPYILVGMKSDLRDSFTDDLKSQGLEPIPTEKGQEMKEKIGAQDYVECSSLKQISIKNVMESALKTILTQIENKTDHVRSDSSTYSDYGSDDEKKKKSSSSDDSD